MDVMFYEVYQEEEAFIKKYLPLKIKAKYTWKTIQESANQAPPALCISIRSQSRIPLAWAKSLDGILARTQGYDHLIAYQKQVDEKIAYGYLGNYCSRAVAEHAVMAMMFLLRKVKKQMKQFEQFHRDGLTGFECQGRKALVVGVGNIGTEIVDVAKGLRMEVRGVDLEKKLNDLTYVSLEKGVAWADVVFCALPLTPLTSGMLNHQLLKNVKPGTVFINISRGEISPVEDLKRLLESGVLGGVSLDVYPEEGFLADCLRGKQKPCRKITKVILALKDLDQVLLTPHNAFNTEEASEEKARHTAKSIVTFLKTKTFPWPVRII
ncbi:MAG: hydroxyacid dehydrogenase [Candidatus Omnitrophica bacterium]|nr:hydroxyacid dehydrogenase [Candidatus Omnitrophota bacterium]